MTSKEAIKLLKKDGWVGKHCKRGSHIKFYHPTKGMVVVPLHNTDFKKAYYTVS